MLPKDPYGYHKLYQQLDIAIDGVGIASKSIADIQKEIATVNSQNNLIYKNLAIDSAINSSIDSIAINSSNNSSVDSSNNSSIDSHKQLNIKNITKHLSKHKSTNYVSAVKRYKSYNEHERLLVKAVPVLQKRFGREDFNDIYKDLQNIKSTQRLRNVLESLGV